MSLITIEQLLESVDLDFEPRFVTKDDEGDITIWAKRPALTEGEYSDYWDACCEYATLEKLKLAEFDGKDWTECIYEVSRKETVVRVREREWIGRKCVFWDKYRDIPYYGILGAVNDNGDAPYWCVGLNRWFMQCELDVDKIKPIALPALVDEQIEDPSSRDAWIHIIVGKIAELIDAVNELKGKFALPTLKPDLTDEDLRKMMCDPKYWRDKDSATIQKVQNGFNKLYGDKN